MEAVDFGVLFAVCGVIVPVLGEVEILCSLFADGIVFNQFINDIIPYVISGVVFSGDCESRRGRFAVIDDVPCRTFLVFAECGLPLEGIIRICRELKEKYENDC